MSSSLIEKSVRSQYRFNVPGIGGVLTTEDLYTLSLEKLNGLAVSLKTQLDKAPTVDFLNDTNTVNDELQTKFDVSLYILKTKKSERDSRVAAKEVESQLREIDAALESKRKDSMLNASEEELMKRRAELLSK